MHGETHRIEALEARRLLSAGDVDLRFGKAGLATASLGGNVSDASVAVEQNGQIVAVASVTTPKSQYDLVVARFDPDGIADKPFGQIAFKEKYQQENILPAQFDSSGQIVIEQENGFIRLTSGGNLDASFGIGGVLTSQNPGAFHVRSDGKIIAVVGDGVERFLSNGKLDTAFGTNGRVEISFPMADGEPNATPVGDSMAIAPNGSILISVASIDDYDVQHAGLVRITAGGRIDHSFGENGLSLLTNYSYPVDVVATSDGGAVMEGGAGGTELMKVKADGKLDPSFGDFYLTDFQEGDPVQLLAAPDGKLITYIDDEWNYDFPPNHDFPLARLNADGTLDATFSGDGWAPLPEQMDQYQVGSIALTPGGSLIAAAPGNVNVYGDIAPLILARIQTSPAHVRLSNAALSADGTLNITGTGAPDTIKVGDDGSDWNGTTDRYSKANPPRLVVNVNGVVGLFDPMKVHRIHIEGSAGDDQINLTYTENIPATINGGSGNDSISSANAPSAISGGAGSDSLYGGSGNDALFGNDGNDYLDSGAGNDFIDGGSGNDRLSGEAGNDTLWGDAGNDTMLGGDGNDEFHAKDGQVDSLDGGPGTDKASVDQSASVSDILRSIEKIV